MQAVGAGFQIPLPRPENRIATWLQGPACTYTAIFARETRYTSTVAYDT